MNKVILAGNLGADPELRVTQGGQAVLKIRMATTEKYLDKNNSWQERTEWHQVTIWGKRGEALAKILEKGSKVLVEGQLRTSSYEKDGEKRYRTEVNATNVELMGGGPRRGGDDDGSAHERRNYGTSGHGASAKHGASKDPGFDDFTDMAGDDELPF